jgi:hypothetical protein
MHTNVCTVVTHTEPMSQWEGMNTSHMLQPLRNQEGRPERRDRESWVTVTFHSGPTVRQRSQQSLKPVGICTESWMIPPQNLGACPPASNLAGGPVLYAVAASSQGGSPRLSSMYVP